ncbi:type VII secretion integral membrane protein EccD [Streptomyces shenzhenensis]|uniref:Type VII secretion integral membrane protein EccD n=1 Tax=Streptomyces shenzhenensis TaxID=943815 RepID=A0A3M0HXA8_9ACTN|nr:type VII secretion integral membrane protein EccD [Streptomyces shenzhenensis]RMB80402.1 type VII secretion integral membrane protein EccD [Streptomyces shenzhenensis]
MPDERCRVTVVGERRQVDLALPAQAPIAEYVPRLATLCGQPESEGMPPVWTLAPSGGSPMAPGDTLSGAGIVDGATLYLRDQRAAELSELTVTDLDEQIANAREDSGLWSARRRAQSVLGAGLVVMVISAAWLGALRIAGVAVLFFVLAALCSALLAWYSERKNWPLPRPVRQLLALAACPLLACAGLGAPVHGPVATPFLVMGTAVIGALAGVVAFPAPATVVLQILTLVTALLVAPLAVLDASPTSSAAAVALVLFVLTGLLPRITSQIAVLVPDGPDTGTPALGSEEVAAVVRRGNGLLTFLSIVTATVLTAALLTLTTSRDVYALSLVACVSVGLLLQAGSVRVLSSVIPLLSAGVLGLVALAVRVPEYLFDSRTAGALAAFAAGAVLVACGLFLAFGAALRPIEPERPNWPGAVVTALVVAALPLTAGVFGLFGWLAGLGGDL